VPPLLTGTEAQFNRLDILLGVQPGTYARTLEPAPQIASLPPVPIDETPQDLLKKRPDIIAAQQHLAATSARIGVALSEYYPKVSVSALLGFESLNAGQLFSSAAFQPSAVVGLRWRLFDFGKVNDEVIQARGSNAELLADYRNVVLNAAGDVENSFMALAQSEQETIELQREVSALTTARDSSDAAYQGGSIALTDVLDADRNLLVTQDQLAQNRGEVAENAVSVFRALGGGW